MELSNSDLKKLYDFRHELHRFPEISGEERETARRVQTFLEQSNPDEIVTGLGGQGIAALYRGQEEGPTVLLRCELDALPIQELSTKPYRSTVEGRGHLCGHDGHMTMISAVGLALGRQRPVRGCVVLLYQPAEETGAGAAAVLADPAYRTLPQPDYAFSLHNVPGIPVGTALLKSGATNCASRGFRIVLEGKTSHASNPEDGLSPMEAMSELMPRLSSLSRGDLDDPDHFRLVTVTHARLGEPTFGIAPGYGEIRATLRTATDQQMNALKNQVTGLVEDAADRYSLSVRTEEHDIFQSCENDGDAVVLLEKAIRSQGLQLETQERPMRWSEDYGLFGKTDPEKGKQTRSAIFFPGSGADQPQLHNPDFDFPDDLIPLGAGVFLAVVRDLLG
ncbi:amidohydrolase [Kiloniella sp. b19]|uniref:amidohydrolase n=1 Tax=Kiloniella sp. GXU_MW_B19 TaxID=3141326 RepID=UPI0031DD2BBE